LAGEHLDHLKLALARAVIIRTLGLQHLEEKGNCPLITGDAPQVAQHAAALFLRLECSHAAFRAHGRHDVEQTRAKNVHITGARGEAIAARLPEIGPMVRAYVVRQER
jgi:hypothetical protein